MVVETKYVTVEREELRELREESAELARLRAAATPAEDGPNYDKFYAGLYHKSSPMWKELHDLAVSKGYDHVRFAIKCAPVYKCDCMGSRKVAIDMDGNTMPCECVEPSNDATPAEAGREVPEVVGYLLEKGNGILSRMSAGHGDHPLMTVAQHSRIVAAKEAELRELRDSMTFRTSLIGRLEAELEQLRAQPARQVGGDERERFEAWFLSHWPANQLYRRDALPASRPQYDEYCNPRPRHSFEGWQARAALAPASMAGDWEPCGQDYDRATHNNPDAKAWADLFVATFPRLADKHDLMLGWFANAMMAMHDWLKSKGDAPAAVAVPKTELWQCQNTENSNLVYLPYKPQGPWDCVSTCAAIQSPA